MPGLSSSESLRLFSGTSIFYKSSTSFTAVKRTFIFYRDHRYRDGFASLRSEPKFSSNRSYSTSAKTCNDHGEMKIWSDSISFTSPEADYASQDSTTKRDVEALKAKKEFIDYVQKKEDVCNDLTYALSQASTGIHFVNPIFMDLLNDRMISQLRNIQPLEHGRSFSQNINQRNRVQVESRSPFLEDPIPRSLEEASSADDSRAIVITEATVPFRIVSVNHSWERLCGYTRHECKGMTLECIQGEDTNRSAVTALMAQLLKGEQAGTLLTNYTKEGRKFHNRLRVGPLRNKDGMMTHFVGVLREVDEIGQCLGDSKVHE